MTTIVASALAQASASNQMLESETHECDEALRLALQILQARSGPSDVRLWRQVLLYAPEAIVLECAEKIRSRQWRQARRAV